MTQSRFRNFLILIAAASILFGCGSLSDLNKANQAFDLYQFQTAITLYSKLYPKEKDRKVKRKIAFNLAESYARMSNFKKAEGWYQKAFKDGYDPVALYKKGDMLKRQEKYEDAILVFKEYVRENPGDPAGQIAIKTCEDALKWRNEKTRYVVESFKAVNSKYNDFAPMPTKRGAIIFTSDREGGITNKYYDWTGVYFTDIWMAEPGKGKGAKLQKPMLIDEDEIVNTKFNDGVVCFDKRESTMYYTQCNDAKGKGHNCRILYVRKKGKVWGEPSVMPFCTDSFAKYGHPSLSPDGKKMFFASNMEGSYGGHDIWMSSYVSRGKTWSDPVNLGPVINTDKDEMYPFIYFDNKTLYFSSDGHPGMGGLDIFKSEWDGENWSTPVNLKAPINSGGDDFSIYVEKGGTVARGYKGYFASNRPEARGDDIYYFYMTPLEYTLSGVVFNMKTRAVIPDATVVLIIDDSAYVTAQTDASGAYKFILEPEHEYKVYAYKKFFFDSEDKFASTVNLEFSEDFVRDLLLDPFIDKEIVLKGIYYDLDKWDLRPESMVILDSLYMTMMKHPYIVIEIGSHTDCRASYAYNDTLSQRRAQSVVNYLKYKGIPEDRMEAHGYGETKLVNDCDCEGNEGKGLNCTEAEHQMNRRTTFRIIRTDYNYGTDAPANIQEPKLRPEGKSGLLKPPAQQPEKPKAKEAEEEEPEEVIEKTK